VPTAPAAVAAAREGFIDLDTTIVVVTFETSMFARAYVEETYTRWPVIVDHRRSLDHAYAMLHGSLREHLGTSNVVRGRLPGAAQGDIAQLGGDVLIEPEGKVTLSPRRLGTCRSLLRRTDYLRASF
jgi:hypothetical protein